MYLWWKASEIGFDLIYHVMIDQSVVPSNLVWPANQSFIEIENMSELPLALNPVQK